MFNLIKILLKIYFLFHIIITIYINIVIMIIDKISLLKFDFLIDLKLEFYI